IAQLVSAHNGDLNAVTTAMVNVLDQLTAAGSQGAQFLSRLGSDNSAIADSIVQGQLPAQIQPRILTMLITGAAPSFGGNRTGNGTGGGGFTPPDGNSTAEANSGAPANPPQPTAVPTVQPPPANTVDVAKVLSDQTGLSADDLNTQITNGSTLAQLVSAHNGDLNAVTTAIAGALDQLVGAGGRTGQLISRLGSDNTAIATQIVQGEVPAQVQQRIVSMLITGAAPSAPADGTGSGGNPPPPGDTNGGAPSTTQNQAAPPPTEAAPTATSLPPTATVARPTPISFPTDTDTPEAAQADAQVTVAATNSATACTLIPNYNLNLRDQPNKDTGSVLVSIPLGTNITADQRTSDGWYHLTYDGHTGWVDGQYASPSAGCSTLPLATPSK
ncbi:MAG: SH3 domain-containing protein, partial [Chloroflexota bacterium]